MPAHDPAQAAGSSIPVIFPIVAKNWRVSSLPCWAPKVSQFLQRSPTPPATQPSRIKLHASRLPAPAFTFHPLLYGGPVPGLRSGHAHLAQPTWKQILKRQSNDRRSESGENYKHENAAGLPPPGLVTMSGPALWLPTEDKVRTAYRRKNRGAPSPKFSPMSSPLAPLLSQRD